MKTKKMLTTIIIATFLVAGLMSSSMVTKIHGQDYNGYNTYQEDRYSNNYNDYEVKIFPPKGILTADLWQWITDIPKDINPLLDETGENCDVGQRGPIWYLVGTPTDSQEDDVNVGFAERDCTILEGKKILIPIITAACSELTDEEIIRDLVNIPEGNIPEDKLKEGLALCAEELIDEIDLLEFSIDGKELTNFKDFRVQSPFFKITLLEDNLFDLPEEILFPDIPQKSTADGFWVLIKGLEPGEHTIEFKRGISGEFESEIIYNLTIEPSYHDNNYNYNNYYYGEDKYDEYSDNDGYDYNRY